MNSGPKKPGVTVVVVGWNNLALLPECLESIGAQSYGSVESIYVDNGSGDGSVEYVRQTFPATRVIEAKTNLGFAVGNNVGFKAALAHKDCRYVVALNSDARLKPDWVAVMVAWAKTHPEAACLQGLTLNYYDHDRVDSAGIYLDWRAAPLQIGYNEPPGLLKSGEVFGVNAAAALYTRTFLDRQPFGDDYFDHDLFMYYEDVDLSARALTLGMKNYFCKEALAWHMGSASSGGNPQFMIKMTHRNLPLVLVKNVPVSIIIRCLPRWVKAEFLRLISFWRQRQYGLIKAMVVGRLTGLLLLPRFIGKRRKLFGLARPQATLYRRLMG